MFVFVFHFDCFSYEPKKKEEGKQTNTQTNTQTHNKNKKKTRRAIKQNNKTKSNQKKGFLLIKMTILVNYENIKGNFPSTFFVSALDMSCNFDKISEAVLNIQLKYVSGSIIFSCFKG